ncbi:SelT/SelW/SelH family protein [Candidatus Microgenomates bacterium]|nr:SelT/SelW/SelH family protein [Candidatus Microgenomates bacterium]
MAKHIKIKYCVPCGYLPRAQEFKKTLEENDARVELIEGDRGVFSARGGLAYGWDFWIDDELVFSKHQEGRFPEISEITNKL